MEFNNHICITISDISIQTELRREHVHNEISERITKEHIHDHNIYQSIENINKNDNHNHKNRQQIISDQNE